MTLEEIKTLAHLARIKLTEEELNKYTPQMTTILESGSVLNEVNTDDMQLDPVHTVSIKELREDVPQESMPRTDVLANASYSQDGYVKVYGDLKDVSAA